jgi:PAS domain S-box-containing protein
MLYILAIMLLCGLLYLVVKYTQLKKQYDILDSRFQNIQELSGTGYFDGSFADDKVWWSDELHKKVGQPLDNRIDNKEKAISLIYEEDREGYLLALQKAIQNQQMVDEEYRAFSVEHDSLRHFHTKARIEFNESGQPIFMKGVVRDITSEKEIADKLELSESRYQELSDLLPIGVFETNSDFNLTYVNKKLIEIFKLNKKDNIVGKNIKILLSYSIQNDVIKNLQSLNHENYLYSKEYNYQLNNSKEISLLLYTSPIYNQRGERIGFRGTIADITERKREQLELQKISKLESLSSLAGGIAHNFKNILSAITLSVDMIRIKDSTIDKELNRISSSLDKANAIATKFQTYTKSYLPNYSQCDINQVIMDAVDLTKAGSTNIFKLSLDKNISKVDIDEMQINEVLMNLLINADQAIKNSGVIEVQTRTLVYNDIGEKKKLEITVKDNGIGIDDSHIDLIFNPFFTTKKDGHGLGLLTVQSIIKQHKGEVLVNSEKGKGTEFKILLPMENGASDLRSYENNENELKSNYNAVILDDDENITSTMKEIFDIKGEMSLSIYNNPNYFLTDFPNLNDLDFIILDINLVGYDMDGYIVLEKIREIDKEIKVIIFSAFMSDDINKLISDKNTYALNKPANYERLKQKIIEIFA